MKEDYLVSIIIPAFNVEEYIERCVTSCATQSYGNIEIVIVNDGSTDNTSLLCNALGRQYDNIVYVEQQNQGVSCARNKAIDICKGDYCVFLDSDDWLEKDAIEKLVSEQAKYNSDMVVSECYFAEYDSDGRIIRKRQGKSEVNDCVSVEEVLSHVGTSSRYKLQSSCYKLFSMQIIKANAIRFDPEIYFGEDGLFTYQYLCNSSKISYINNALWNILDRPGSATKSSFNPKMISGIKAVERMMEYRDISVKVSNNLRGLRGERAMWVMINSIRCDNNEYLSVAIASRKILRNDFIHLLKRNRSIKLLFQLLVLCVLPIRVTGLLCKV